MINNFKENLATNRKLKKLTQKQLAEMLNVDQRTISAWENGVCEPSISMLIKLTDIFNESLDEIISK